MSSASDVAADAPAWHHLDVRVVIVNAAMFLASLAIGFIELFVFPNNDLWPLLVAAGAGMIDTSVNLIRWMTTRYRITADRVEVRSGLVRREYRGAPRDRIRSVDTTAKLRHRVTQLRVVHIGAGEERLEATFKLDALSKGAAVLLRDELMPGAPVDGEDVANGEVVISRFRWHWMFYAMFQFWVLLAAGLFLNTCYWALKAVGVDLIDIAEGLADDGHLSTGWTITLAVLIAMPLGGAVLAAEFVTKFWNFQLSRSAESGGALITRQGLFSTQTVHREDRRIRGIHLHEPLVLAWMHLTQASVVITGIHKLRNEASHFLPRCPRAEVIRVARSVLPDGHLPLEAELHRHPLGALRKRIFIASVQFLALAALLYWLSLGDVVPTWSWWIAVGALPLAWLVAAISYTWLGHVVQGPYVVFRKGALNKTTVALQSRAIAGWRLHQTPFQRIGKRITVGIPTAAGDRFYDAPDVGTTQAFALITTVTPALANAFIEPSMSTVAVRPRAALSDGDTDR